ncbi:hypothetical protein LINPERHAP2_LOCUS22728 [Linum perenne]
MTETSKEPDTSIGELEGVFSALDVHDTDETNHDNRGNIRFGHLRQEISDMLLLGGAAAATGGGAAAARGGAAAAGSLRELLLGA